MTFAATLCSCLQTDRGGESAAVLMVSLMQSHIWVDFVVDPRFFFASTQNTNSKFQSDLGYGRRAALRMCYH